MRLAKLFQLFLLAPLLFTRTSQSDVNQQNTCKTKDPYAKGFLVYSELLLATIKKQMNRVKEACDEKTHKDTCNGLVENLEKEIRYVSETKESLQKEIRELERVIAMQRRDIETIRESLESPFDCSDIQLLKSRESGIYKIRHNRTGEYVEVFCDLDRAKNGGGWTVFLSREYQTTPLSFNRTWKDYKEGFGNKNSEFWLGNDLLHALTTSDSSPSSLRVDAEDFNGDSRWAEWNIFSVGDEESIYTLTVKQYQETSTLGDGMRFHGGSSFTTLDADNDNSPDFNCAHRMTSVNLTGGFWYDSCGEVRPTDVLVNTTAYLDSAFWAPWINGPSSGSKSLRRISMKFRRLNYNKLASPKKKSNLYN